jgi:hypothetical protein
MIRCEPEELEEFEDEKPDGKQDELVNKYCWRKPNLI